MKRPKREPTTDGPLGSFEEQVMLAVVHAGDEAFGRGVRRELEARTGRDVVIGAVYATLDRLEAKGLVSSSRPASFGGARRVFRVTDSGRRALVATRAIRARLWRGVVLPKLTFG